MISVDAAASLFGKIEAVLAKLDESKPTQALMADICFALRSLLREQQQKPTATGLVKPKKRERAAYYRAYRLRVKARRAR